MFLVGSVEKLLEMAILSGSALTSPLVQIRENLEFHDFWYKGTRATGLDVCSGMVGCHYWLILVVVPLRLRLLRILP